MDGARAGTLVLSDLVALKGMSAEVVMQLSLDAMAAAPTHRAVTERARAHVDEELEHVRLCQDALTAFGPFEPARLHVRLFRLIMRLVAIQPRRTSTLAVATLLCTAIESSALPSVSKAVVDQRLREALSRIAGDELEHYRFVSSLWLARRDGLFSKAWDLSIGVALGAVAVFFWWPHIAPAYRALGLRPDAFADELVARLAANFRVTAHTRVRRLLRQLIIWSTSMGEAQDERPRRLPV